MSGREAGVGMQLPNPGSPGWVLPARSSQELPCRRGAREREVILPRVSCRVWDQQGSPQGQRGKGSCGWDTGSCCFPLGLSQVLWPKDSFPHSSAS